MSIKTREVSHHLYSVSTAVGSQNRTGQHLPAGCEALSLGQGGGEERQASGSRAEAAGGASACCPAGAAPAEDAPGALQDLGVAESCQEQAR